MVTSESQKSDHTHLDYALFMFKEVFGCRCCSYTCQRGQNGRTDPWCPYIDSTIIYQRNESRIR